MLEPDMILSKMDELIASVKAASIPLEERWLDSSAAAALMGYSPRHRRTGVVPRWRGVASRLASP